MTKSTAVAALTMLLGACSGDRARTADTAAAIDTSAMSAVPADTQGAAATPSSSGTLDPNSASEAELTAIPGVTSQVATAVVSGRPYSNNVALNRALSGLSEQQRDSVFARLWIPVELNSATDDEILLIPGVGSRMLREFKEYRPYTSMEQFRREIGKYVDQAELARLERYVTLRQ